MYHCFSVAIHAVSNILLLLLLLETSVICKFQSFVGELSGSIIVDSIHTST